MARTPSVSNHNRRVTTATLIRGQVYNFRIPHEPNKEPLRFVRGKPLVIADASVAAMLEDVYDETQDGDGETFEKPVFLIQRGVQPPDSDTPRPRRLSADRGDNSTKRRRRLA